jgi:tetratricopeptide (TPR) repeat protein
MVRSAPSGGFRWHHGVIAAMVGLVLVGGGIAGSWWLMQPHLDPASATVAVVTEPAPAKAEPKIKAHVETPAKADPDQQKQQDRFIALMIAGSKAQQLKKWDDAIAAYGDAQKIFPDNADLKTNLLAVKTAKAEALQAVADERALKREVAALNKQAQQFLDLKQPVEATKLLQVALSKIPDDPTATKLLADIQTAAQAADPKTVGEKFDAHILAGRASLKANQPADAIREFLAAKELIPDDPLPPDLIREAEKALVLVKNAKPADKKTDFQNLMEKAKQLAKDKKYKEAAGAYQQALLLQPGDADATAGLAAVQAQAVAGVGDAKTLQASGDQALRNRQVDDAINFYKQAQQADPDNADVQRMLQTAIAIKANQAAYYNAVANGTQAMIDHRYGDAVIAFQAALSIAPGDSYVSGNLTAAQNAVIQLNVMQARYQALTAQASAALRIQQYSRALQLLKDAAAVIAPPLFVDAGTQRMAIYADAMARATQAMSQNRFQDAANLFQAALQAAPGDAFATAGLQQAQQRLRQTPPRR